MKKIGMKGRVLGLVLILALALSGCQGTAADDELTVAVAIPPQKTFVEAIAGDLVNVVTLIPPGASPANYQPSPKEMAGLEKAEVYFSIGVPTEEGNILPLVTKDYENLRVVHLDEVVDGVYEARFFEDEHSHEDEDHDDHDEDHDEDHEDEDNEEDHDEDDDDHHHEGRDPHIWLSPKRVMVIVDEILDVLKELDPDNASTYTSNADAFKALLEEVHEEFEKTEELKGLEFIIMHPSLGYFADDYGLHMEAIEQDGKNATSAHLEHVIEYAKEEGIKTVFYQEEFDSTQAKTIADEIDGQVVVLDVLSEDYISNLRTILNALTGK